MKKNGEKSLKNAISRRRKISRAPNCVESVQNVQMWVFKSNPRSPFSEKIGPKSAILGSKIFFLSKNRFFWAKSSKNVKMLKRHFRADCGFYKRDRAFSKFWPIFDPPQSRHIGHFQHPHRVFWAIWTR